MSGHVLTPETYEQLEQGGYYYLALTDVNMDIKGGLTEFVFTALKNMPFSFAQSLTSIQDEMIKGIVFGRNKRLRIQCLLSGEESAMAA